MNQEEIKQRMHEIKSKITLLEWDRKHSYAFLKDHIYRELKEEYEKLEKELEYRAKSGSQ